MNARHTLTFLLSSTFSSLKLNADLLFLTVPYGDDVIEFGETKKYYTLFGKIGLDTNADVFRKVDNNLVFVELGLDGTGKLKEKK